jgi:hypothetical protein
MGLSVAQACALLRREETERGCAGTCAGAKAAARAAVRAAARCCHWIERASCRLCGGRRMCVHLAERKFCQECRGTRVCEHLRNRCVCVECGGNRVCRTCRVRIVLKRDSDCVLCQGAREWAAWMEGRSPAIKPREETKGAC